MKINNLFTTLLLMLLSIGVYAQSEKEPYVVIDKDGTATFYYNKSKPEGALPIQSYNDSNWTDDIKESIKKVVFNESFADFKPTSLRNLFFYFVYLTTIEDIQYLNTSEVTDMAGLFSCCSSLKNLDLSSFNTTKVTDMNNMFLWCQSLSNLNVSNFNTSNVTNMEGMFYECSSLTNLDVSSFNTENVITMKMMFQNCYHLVNLDLSGFNTSHVTNMMQMFDDCGCLTTIDLSSFNTSNVSSMRGMFLGCRSLSSLDLSKFNTSHVTNMYGMFLGCKSMRSIDLSNFNTVNVTDMSFMFALCDKLSSIIVGEGWTTSSVVESERMFYLSSRLYGSKGSSPKSLQVEDATYAKIDGGSSDPGYLTASNESEFSKIESIKIITMPKTDYKEGEDFSAENGLLELSYNTGEKDTIDLATATITGFDKTKIGEQILKVEYQGVETTFTTPVSSTPDNKSNINVWSSNRTIFIESTPDTKYTIIDLNGRMIKSATTKSTKEEINTLKSGVYIVVIGNDSYKVSLR